MKPLNSHKSRKAAKSHTRHLQLIYSETVRALDVTAAEGQHYWAMAKAFLKDPNIVGLQGDPEES